MEEKNICDHCGCEETEDNHIEWRRDPYLDEVHSERREVFWCERCYDERAGDI